MISCSPRTRRHWSGGSRGQEVPVIRDQLLPHLQPRQRQRLALAREQRTPRARAPRRSRPARSHASASFTNGSSRGSATALRSCLPPPRLVGEVEREHVAVDLEERRLAHRVAHRAVVVERRADQPATQSSRPCARRCRAPSALALRLHRSAAGSSQASHGFRSDSAQRWKRSGWNCAPQLRRRIRSTSPAPAAARTARRRAG